MSGKIENLIKCVEYTPRRGAIIIGVIQFITAIASLVIFSSMAYYGKGFFKDLHISSDDSLRCTAIIALFVNIIMIFSCVSLVYGAYKRIAIYIMPWIAFYFLVVLLYVIATIGWCVYHTEGETNELYLIVGIVIGSNFVANGIFMLIVVLTTYTEINFSEDVSTDKEAEIDFN